MYKFFCIFLFTLISTSLAQHREFKVLRYLQNLPDSLTIAGQHNREPNADPDK